MVRFNLSIYCHIGYWCSKVSRVKNTQHIKHSIINIDRHRLLLPEKNTKISTKTNKKNVHLMSPEINRNGFLVEQDSIQNDYLVVDNHEQHNFQVGKLKIEEEQPMLTPVIEEEQNEKKPFHNVKLNKSEEEQPMLEDRLEDQDSFLSVV